MNNRHIVRFCRKQTETGDVTGRDSTEIRAIRRKKPLMELRSTMLWFYAECVLRRVSN